MLDSPLRIFFDACPQPMWLVDKKSKQILHVNPAATELLGYSYAEFLALPADYLLLPNDDRSGEDHLGEEFLHIAKWHNPVTRLRSKNDRLIDVKISERHVTTPELDAYVCLAQDVTEQVKTERTLQLLSKTGVVLIESFDPYTIFKTASLLALESLADICIVDVVEFPNTEKQSAERLISVHRDLKLDRLACKLKEFPPTLHESDVVYDVITKHKARLTLDIVSEIAYTTERGREYAQRLKELHCRSAIIAPIESHNNVFGAISLIRCGTSSNFSPDDMPLAEEFVRRVALAIENARLYQEAHRSNDAKTQFLANLSHEIRTPLAAIIGFTELLYDDDAEAGERRGYLEIIHRNGKQLSELIGEFLDLTKIESGRLELNLNALSLKNVMEEMTDLFSAKSRDKGIAIRVIMPPGLPDLIISDQLRLKQILINLIGNAIKFSGSGIIDIQVRAVPQNNHLRITIDIKDNGIGISPEHQQRLFQAFAQADSTMARRFGGTGLGLLLSRKLARALGGDVELISSEVGKGSLFRITFLAELTAQSVAVELSGDPKEATRPLVDHNEDIRNPELKRVLVAEDSVDNLLLIRKLLKNESVVVDAAANGAEAIEMGSDGHYDLILMDIQMPEVDGYAATRQLRKQGVKSPIVALTAHALNEDREHCLSAGCDGYMTKPIDGSQLRRLVRRYLEPPH